MIKKIFDSVYDWTMFYLDNSILSDEKKEQIKNTMDTLRDKTDGNRRDSKKQ